jgi:pimeloyl-ACP methyl ester carboxylesterase
MPDAGGVFYSGHIADEPFLAAPIVLLHGAGGSRLDWAMRRLPGRVVIAIDLPGHGALIDQPGRSTIADYTAVVVRFLDALHITRAVFVGHSMGGAIALKLALDQPDRVAGLVLIATGARLRVHPAMLNDILHNPQSAAQQISDWSWSRQVPPEIRQGMVKRLLAIPPQTLHDDFAACNAFDVSERVNTIQAPTLILVGSDDQMTPLKYSTFLAERIGGSRLQVIPNAGHMLPLEQPAVVTANITNWLMRVSDVAPGR